MNLNHAIALSIALALIATGVCIGYMVWGRQTVEVVEAPAAPVWHDDGSVTAIRAPNAKADLPEPSAPKGGRLVRTVEVTVKPDQIPPGATECEPVKVRLDMREYSEGPDLGVRVSMRAEGGEILDSVDIPRDSIYMPRDTRNVVGFSRIGDTTTLTYQRSFGALDVGPSVELPDGERAIVGVALGWRF